MAAAFEKVWVADRDVLRARNNPLADIGQNNFAIHHTENPLVNRHNRTVTTEMFAAAACLGGSRNPMGALRHHHMGLFLKRRQPRSVRHLKILAPERHSRRRLWRR